LGPSAGPTRAPLGPHVLHWHCPHHRFVGAAPQALPSVDLSRFASMVTMEWSWIFGSTVMDLEPSNRTWNYLTGQIFTRAAFTTAFGSQPRPYDRKAVKSRVGRCPTYAARRPTSTPPPLLQTHARKHTLKQSYASV
jgi:hypothetical protein